MSRTKGAKGKAEPKQIKKVSIRLDQKTYEKAKELADAKGESINKYLKEMTEQLINLYSK